MNLVIHQFKKDVRQFRWEIGVYAGSLVLLFAIIAPFNPSHGRSPWLLIPMGVSWAACWGAGVLTIVEVIQAEPHFGDNAFWLTRPLAPRTVLAAKALFFVVCFTVPAIIGWVMMWIWGDIVPSYEPDTAKTSLYGWAVLGIVVALAALSHTPSRAITLGVVGYAIYFLVRFVRDYSLAGLWDGVPATVATTAKLLTCTLLGPSVLLVMAYTRRWGWGLATALGGIVLVVVLPAIFWAFD